MRVSDCVPVVRRTMLFVYCYCLVVFISSAKVVIEASPRIVGGNIANQGDYPYFVATPYCGGVLIADEWVLTAAHCGNIRGETVYIGAYQWQTARYGTQVATCTRYIEHPNYDDRTKNNDVALCKLNRKIEIDEQRVKLRLNIDRNYPQAGLDARVMGFGQLSENGGDTDFLRDVTVKVRSQQSCASSYGSDFYPGMVCAGDYGKDSCYGDSGGPLIRRVTNIDGTFTDIHMAIVSFGIECGNPNYPAVYWQTSFAEPFIFRQICESPQGSPNSSFCRTDTSSPSKSPTNAPTVSPTKKPTRKPTKKPTQNPTKKTTASPTTSPTDVPTVSPTTSPTEAPTDSPTLSPTKSPTDAPTDSPTLSPTNIPTVSPTTSPTDAPTVSPTASPTQTPTNSPTVSPTDAPTASPTVTPSDVPTESNIPTEFPTVSGAPSISSAPSNPIPESSVRAGGKNNDVFSDFAAVSGGFENTVKENSSFSVIKGGARNTVEGESSAVSGVNNRIVEKTRSSSVVNGRDNSIQDTRGRNVISGGSANSINVFFVDSGNRQVKSINTKSNTIQGGKSNSISAGSFSTVIGGEFNTIGSANGSSSYSTISGGQANFAGADFATVLGGRNNRAMGKGSVSIGSGAFNEGENSLFINLVGEKKVNVDNSFIVSASQITFQIGKKKAVITKNNIQRLKEILNPDDPIEIFS